MLLLCRLRMIVGLMVIIIPLMAPPAFTQQDPRELFERARLLDESNQRLTEAIQLYSQVIKQARQQRALAARAQLRIGLLYERLGRKAEARRAFQLVVNQYADQTEIAQQAKAKLAATQAENGKAVATMEVRRVLGYPETNSDFYLLSSPSPEGRYLCYRDGQTLDLAVRELATGEKRRLTANQSLSLEAKGYPQFPIFSPDSKQIAYAWVKRDRTQELRLIGLDGSGLRLLYAHDEIVSIQPAEWAVGGQQILALLFRKDRANQIAFISVTDGSARVLKTFDRSAPERISLSPDGRYVAYDFRSVPGSTTRDIFLLATESGEEIHLVNHPAHDRLYGWTPDGKGILFGSDRAGTMSVWLVQVADGQVQGSPQMVKQDIGRVFYPMGFTRQGDYYYSQEISNIEPLMAVLDFAAGQFLAPPVAIGRSANGHFASPDWSPDGQYLAYGSVRSLTPWKTGPDLLVIRELVTGKERYLTPALNSFGSFRWAPDGRSIMVIGDENNGNRGLYRIDANTGEVTSILPTDPKKSWIAQAEWFPDGKTILYCWENRFLIRDLVTGREKELYQGPARYLALSPDGRQLAVVLAQALKIIPIAGGEPRELLAVQQPESFTTVGWTPDGRHLLFGKDDMSKPGLPTELWRVLADGGEPQKLGLRVDGLRELRVHPDGQRIAFSTFRLWREVWIMQHFLPAAQSRKASVQQRSSNQVMPRKQ